MVMSQGTYTFLACFGGFWLVWAMVVLLCCLCSFLQRRLKRMKEERHREQCLRTVEAESLSCHAPSHTGHAPSHPNHAPTVTPAAAAPCRESPHVCTLQAVPGTAPSLHIQHQMPQANWVTMTTDTDVFGKPPCYEEAVLMEDPPPPYSEVLADPRGGTYFKPGVLRPSYPMPIPVPASLPTPVPTHSHIPANLPVAAQTQSHAPCPNLPVQGHTHIPAHLPIPALTHSHAPCSNTTHLPVQAHTHIPTNLHVSSHSPVPLPNYPTNLSETKPPLIPDRGYSSLIRLPSSQRWDSLGHLLSNMELSHAHLTPPPSIHGLHLATMPRRDVRAPHEQRHGSGSGGYSSLRGRTHSGGHRRLHRVGGLEQSCGLNSAALPLLGRSTAV